MRSCTVIDCKRIIFGQKMEAAGLGSYYFKTIYQTFMSVQDDHDVVPLQKQSRSCNIVFVEVHHY